MHRFCFYLALLTLALAMQPQLKAVEPEAPDFVSLFDGESLEGWQGDEPYWSVRDGAILGQITEQTKIHQNRFLIYQGDIPANFELIAEYRVSPNGNSGINYRSDVLADIDFHALKGYQCDIDGQNQYTGSNYEERRRTTLASQGESVLIPAMEESGKLQHVRHNRWSVGVLQKNAEIAPVNQLRESMRTGEWNEVRIVARGNVLRHYINGQLTSEVVDNDAVNSRSSGRLGVQVHVGPPMTIEYRNLRIRALSPAE